jgi:hypothetical protein
MNLPPDGKRIATQFYPPGEFQMPKPAKSAATRQDNAVVRSALEAVEQIDREAREKKLAQAEALQTTKAAIEGRIQDLQHQLTQINTALAAINGTPAPHEKNGRRDLAADRQRVAQWMEARKGQKFAARDLLQEFPELENVQISYLLKPLMQEGKIHTDTSEGMKRPKYFVVA